MAGIRDCVRKRRLRWFGHMERMDVDNWVKKCRDLDVEGSRGRGRPRKTLEFGLEYIYNGEFTGV